MNEITNIINDYSSANNENFQDIDLHSSQEQIDSGLNSLKISMIQIRQIINVLNSQFYNSSNSISDISQTSIRIYYELFQTIAKGLKPVEAAIQNPNFSLITSKNNYEKLYFKFITDFIGLILAINLPKEVFNPICNFFSPLLVIFMRNLINEKTNISLEDFSLILQLNQGSFVVFESIIKKLFSNNFYKLDSVYNLIHEDDDSNTGENNILNKSFEELKKSLIWTDKYVQQSQSILNSIFTIRCEILSHRSNKIKLSALLNEIETIAKTCIYYSNAKESLNEFLTFLNSTNLNINISTHFSNCGLLQQFYEKINKFQLLELNKLLENDLISIEFAEEMKAILENIFNYQENSTLDKVFSLVDVQLYNYHHRPPDQEESKNEEDQPSNSKRMKKEEYDLNLQKMIPPTNYDQTIETFLDFIRNPDIGGEIPLTLAKDMMTLQFTEVISVFKKDKLNHPITNEIDFLEELVSELSFLLSKSIDYGNSDNHKCTLFLSIYVGTIKVLLIAKDKYKDSDDNFQQILKAFRHYVPPLSYIMKILNVNERFQSLQQASKFLMEESAAQTSPNNENDENNEKEQNPDSLENDKQLSEEKIRFFGSNDVANKLIFELDLASHILTFIEKNEKFFELIDCTDFSTDIWQEDTDVESGESSFIIDENNINASLSLLTLFGIEGFYFDISPDFFINWITLNFSTLNKKIESLPLIDFVPFCDFSELSGAIINSCTLVDLYSRINGTESTINLINAAESMKFNMLYVLTAHRLDEVYLTKQVQMCIKESRNFPNVFKKINVLCHTILTKICSNVQIFDFIKYVRILNPSKITSIIPIEIINYSIEILKKLKLVSQSKCLPLEFIEAINDVGQKLTSIVADQESNPLPLFFSQEIDQVASNVYSVLNEVRKVMDTFDITSIASQVSIYIDEILIYYETQQDEKPENGKCVFSLEAFNAIYALKQQVDELVFSNKLINAEVAVIKMQLILEKAECIFPKLDKPLEEFNEMINVSYSIFSIKTLLNFAYFAMTQYTKNGINLKNWFEGEFDENFIFCKEDENIDFQFTSLMEVYINGLISGMSELQNRISSVSSENEAVEQDPNSRNYNPQLMIRSKLINDINSAFQTLSNALKSKLTILNNRKISPEIPQLENDCYDLIQQYISFPNQSHNLLSIYKKIKLKILPSSSQLVTQFESENLQLSLKNITIKEMEKKIEILQEELNKKQNQIDQSADSSFIDSKKKQRERSNQIIELIKQSICNPIKPSNSNVNEVDVNNNDVPVDDANYEIIQKLKKQLNDLDQENLKLKNEIREIERHHKISREDQIDLLMNKSCTFPNPNIPNASNEKSTAGGINKKDNEFLSKQVKELNESIDKMKKKIQTDKKQGSNEAIIIKLFKDIRPRGFSETLVNEDIFKQITKSTRETADKVMKEWRTLRADLDSYESGM